MVFYPEILQQFKIIELTKILRQKDDIQLQTALNNFAEGQCSDIDLQFYQNLENTQENWTELGQNITAIFHLNEQIDEFNQIMQKQLFEQSTTKYIARYR